MFSFITGLFGPVEKLIDTVVTSDEERLQLRNELEKIQAGVHAKTTELMIAEASSDHFLVAAWRPISTLVLMFLIIADAYGWAKAPPQIYSLAEAFISVYALGRSGEKISKAFKKT